MLPLALFPGLLGTHASVTFWSPPPPAPPSGREQTLLSAGVACGGVSLLAAVLPTRRRQWQRRRQFPRAFLRAVAVTTPPPEVGAAESDVVVVGAGLAGLGAGLAAARAGLRVRIVDTAPRRPGEAWPRKAPAEDKVQLPLEPGQKGIWTEYPNILGLLDKLAPGGSEAVLTRPTSSGFYSPRGLEVSAPVLGNFPRLPAPFGSLVYTSPYFEEVSLEARLSALPLLPKLLDALAVRPEDEDSSGLDDVSAEAIFREADLDPALCDAFLRPVLQALLFRPPSELSAFITLRVLWCYVFKSQASFDVRWPVAPLDELLTAPVVQEIQRLGGIFDAGTRLTDLQCDEQGRVVGLTLDSAAGHRTVRAGAVVLAAGAAGSRRIFEGCSPLVRERLGGGNSGGLLDGLANLKSTECTAVRFALDRRCPAKFPSNVLSGFEGLEETGATYFMLERLQDAHLRSYARNTPGGSRLRDRSIVAVDLYGSDRGQLASMSDDEVVSYAAGLLRRAEPIAFRGAEVAKDVEATVLRARGAATHFAPGSRRHRPRQQTPLPNLFLAGDYIKGLQFGAEGLSQERALASGYTAANLAMDALEGSGLGSWMRGSLKRQVVLQLSPDEPQVELLRKVWPRVRGF